MASAARSRNDCPQTSGTWHAVDVDDGDLTTREGNRAVVERFGRLDAVVANAGFQHVAPVAEFPEDRWDALLALLLTSPFLLGPAGRSVTGAPLVMDLGWTAC